MEATIRQLIDISEESGHTDCTLCLTHAQFKDLCTEMGTMAPERRLGVEILIGYGGQVHRLFGKGLADARVH